MPGRIWEPPRSRRKGSSAQPGMGPRRPAPAPSPPVICCPNPSLRPVLRGGGRRRCPGRGCEDGEGSREGPEPRREGEELFRGKLCRRCRGPGGRGAVRRAVLGGTRGCGVPAHASAAQTPSRAAFARCHLFTLIFCACR